MIKFFLYVYFLGKGVGDLNIKAECMFLIQTCEIEDCAKYIPTVSQTFPALQLGWFSIYDLGSSLSNYDISFKMKSTNPRFRVDFGVTNQSENKSRITFGTDDADNNVPLQICEWDDRGVLTAHNLSYTFSSNSEETCQLTRNNGQTVAKINNNSETVSDISNLRYIGITTWGANSKTVTITDLKIKPL